jgi:hypothetical protein
MVAMVYSVWVEVLRNADATERASEDTGQKTTEESFNEARTLWLRLKRVREDGTCQSGKPIIIA